MRLGAQAEKLPGQISGGQQQRVAIARAIVVEPPLVLMDEPLSNLDAKLRLEMRAEIRRIHNLLGCATIYVTHDQDEALSLADRIVVLRDGAGAPDRHAGDAVCAPRPCRRRRVHGLPQRDPRARHPRGQRRQVAIGPALIDGTLVDDVADGQAIAAIRPEDLVAARGRPDRGQRADGGISRAGLLRRGGDGRGAGAVLPRRHRWPTGETLQLGADPARVLVYAAVVCMRDRVPLSRAASRTRARRRDAAGRCRRCCSCWRCSSTRSCTGSCCRSSPRRATGSPTTRRFFADPFLYDTIGKTLWLAVPVTLLNVALSVPVALRVRLMRRQRLLTTILVIPITLGTVLVAEGMLNYLGPRGWFNRALMAIGLSHHPVRLIHNYWGVFLSLVITGFPFTFLLTLSYVTGIDPSLEQAGAMLGAGARQRFREILLPLLVPGLGDHLLPVLRAGVLGVPLRRAAGRPGRGHAGDLDRRLQAAFEDYDYSMASAIAMLMAAVQIGIVAVLLGLQNAFYRGPAGGGKG